jgi:hypothetical protein
MPWETHDGYVQAADILDMKESDAMSDAVTLLALANYFLENKTFGTKAVELLRTWFIDESTMMNPALDHAAMIPGVTNGSSTGIIVTSHRWNSRVTDSVALLISTGALPNTVQEGLASWNRKYLDWMLSSKNGRKEANMHQNHATWHTVQASALAVAVGDDNTAAERLLRLVNSSTPAALGRQIRPSGLMPYEANRSNGITYSCMSVAALFNAATIAKNLQNTAVAPPDLFTYQNETDHTGSIRAALDYLLTFATNRSKPWPFSQTTDAAPWTQLAPVMLQAATRYNEPRYEQMIEKLPWGAAPNPNPHWPTPASWATAVNRLLFPSTHKMNGLSASSSTLKPSSIWTPPCAQALTTLNNSAAYLLKRAVVEEDDLPLVTAQARRACAATAKPCAWNGTDAICGPGGDYSFKTNASYCFRMAMPDWVQFASAVTAMEVAGNNSLAPSPGGNNWWANPARATVGKGTVLQSFTLAQPIFVPEACTNPEDMTALVDQLNANCLKDPSVVYCNVGVQAYPNPT